MQLESTYRLNSLKGITSDLDRATTRVARVWNDRVSEAIDAKYINRIIDSCQTAINDLDTHISRAETLYQRLYIIGR